MKIAYRIGAVIIALISFPVLWFQKFISFAVDVNLGENSFIMKDEFSLQQIFKLLEDDSGKISFTMPHLSAELAEALQPLKLSAILSAVFLILIPLIAIAVIICAAFTNAKKVNLCISAAGMLASFGAIISFRSMSQIVISGELPLSKIVTAALASADSSIAKIAAFFGVGSLADSLATLEIFQLSSAVVMQIIIFMSVFAWCGSFILVGIGDKKENKIKR